MPYSLSSGGGNISGEISLSSFAFQKTNQHQDIGPDLVQILDFPYPCKIYILNEEGTRVEIRFSANDLHASAILISPGVCWIETFSSVSLFAKSDGQARIRITIFSNQPSNQPSECNNLNITSLEIIAGEPNTGFEVTTVPVTFTLEVRRENLGMVIDASDTNVDIMLSSLYPETSIPVIPGTDPFDLSSEYLFNQQFLNNSQVWERQVTIETPGRYFIGSDFNWAGLRHIARLEIDLANSKITIQSEIPI